MLVAAPIYQFQVSRESKQEAQLLDPQICLLQVLQAVPAIGGLDQLFERIERSGLDPVADREFVTRSLSPQLCWGD